MDSLIKKPLPDFAEKLLEATKRNPDVAKVEHDPSRKALIITRRDNYKGVIYYYNIELAYLKLPENEREARLSSIVENINSPGVPDDFEIAQDLIMPLIRTKNFAHIGALQKNWEC